VSEDLRWPEFRTLIIDVANELGARRKETWAVADWHEDHAYPAATLDGPEGARLFIQFGFASGGKITVTARLPEGTSAREGPFTASVDPARGARAIAQAADARVLRAGYLDILPGKVAEKQAIDAIRAARDTAATRAAALFGVPAPEDRKLSLSRFLSKRAEADFGWEDGQEVSLELHGVPLETALRMLAVLAEDTSAACCYSYGPGHHPDLSTVGCLREDAERGHNASRQRIIGLLAEHGIEASRAGQLLASAYRNGRVCQLPGTGITADYDFDHGEFTVSIPRRPQASAPARNERDAAMTSARTSARNAQDEQSRPGEGNQVPPAGAEEERVILAVSAGVDFAMQQLGLGSERDDDLAGVIARAIEDAWRRPGQPPTWQQFIAEHYDAKPGTQYDPATWWDFAPAAGGEDTAGDAATEAKTFAQTLSDTIGEPYAHATPAEGRQSAPGVIQVRPSADMAAHQAELSARVAALGFDEDQLQKPAIRKTSATQHGAVGSPLRKQEPNRGKGL
jgi:hypothetical protein